MSNNRTKKKKAYNTIIDQSKLLLLCVFSYFKIGLFFGFFSFATKPLYRLINNTCRIASLHEEIKERGIKERGRER